MITILKGCESGKIAITLPKGDWVGVRVHYQTVVREITLAEGATSASFAFTAAETAPMALGTYPVGIVTTAADGTGQAQAVDVKIRVTDCPAEVEDASGITIGDSELDKKLAAVEEKIAAAVSAADTATTKLAAHTSDHANPHAVTAEQVDAYTKAEVAAKYAGLYEGALMLPAKKVDDVWQYAKVGWYEVDGERTLTVSQELYKRDSNGNWDEVAE